MAGMEQAAACEYMKIFYQKSFSTLFIDTFTK